MKQNTIQNIPARALLTLAATVLLAGCVKHNLEQRPTPPPVPDDGIAEITLDWGGDERPQTARFLFYDENGDLVREETGLTDGFKGTLPAGKYRLVVHNEDAQQVDYRGTDSYETAEVYAQQTNYTDGHHPAEGVPCILEPQAVFGIGVCNEFDEIVVEAGKTTKATVAPEELTRQVVFHFTIKSDTEVQSLKGVLNGVAPGVFLASGRHNTVTSCALEFTASPTSRAASGDYTAQLGVFNLLTSVQSPDGTNVVHAAVTLLGGQQFTADVDLTPTLRKMLADQEEDILPTEIPLDITFTVTELGLSATVGEWTEGPGGSDIVD